MVLDVDNKYYNGWICQEQERTPQETHAAIKENEESFKTAYGCCGIIRYLVLEQ